MLGVIKRRFPSLTANHPLTLREASRLPRELPTFIRKLTVLWTALGYAALVHGAFFLAALIGYGHVFSSVPPVLMPFLTPFGTPIALGMLHSVLYWAMLVGICNYTTLLIARDMETHTWTILRTTPYNGQ